MFLRFSALALGIGLVAVAGCGPAKLDVNKTYTLDSGDTQFVILDAQSKPQKITVEFESSADLTVMLIKSSDLGKDEDNFVDVKKAIAFKKGEKSGSFSGDVPENTETHVIVRNPSAKANVKLHITNK